MAIEYKGTRAGNLRRGDNPGVDTATIVHVYHADAGEDEFAILAQPEIPAYHQAHPKTTALANTSVNIERSEGTRNNLVYEVECVYDKLESPGFEENPNETKYPWDASLFNFSLLPVDNIVPFDLAYVNGDEEGKPTRPVVASSGTPLGASTNKPNLNLKFSYYVQDINDSWILDYFNTLNDADITIADVSIPARKGLLKTFNPSLLRSYDEDGNLKYNYYQIDVEIEIRNEGWTKSLANTSVFMIASNGSPARIYHDGLGKYPATTYGFGTRQDIFAAIDADNGLSDDEKDDLKDGVQPVDEPITLDNDTGGLSFTSDGHFDPQYIDFNEFFIKSWAPLNLPHTRY